MRKLLAVLGCLLAFAVSCKSTDVIKWSDNGPLDPFDNIEPLDPDLPNYISPELLTEYDIIVADMEEDKRCGGTAINTGDSVSILTAAHCVMDDEELPFDYMFIFDGDFEYRVVVQKIDRFHDLALLTITDFTISTLETAAIGKSIRLGEEVWVVGFGAGVEDVITKGIVSKLNQPNHSRIPNTLLDVTAFYGNSGGGVFNVNSELIGVIVQIGPGGPGDGWIFAVRLEDIKAFLR